MRNPSNARRSKESCPSPLSRKSLKATRSRISKPTVIARRRIANWPRWRRLSLPGTWNSSNEIRETGKGLYFYSQTKGSGKTRLAVSIANDLIQKKIIAAKFATTIQILDQIKATWGGEWKNEETEQKLIQEIVSVPVLVIDDIGVEAVKPWINERFYNILNGRMIEKRVTIFTSNCRMEELNFDDRIINRIIKMALPVQFPDESIRTAIARKENDDLLDRLLGA